MKKYAIGLFILLAFVGVLGIVALMGASVAKGLPRALSTAFPTSTPIPTPIGLHAKKLTELVNNWRTTNNLPAYIQDDRLCEIAYDRADDEKLDFHKGLYKNYKNSPYPLQENLTTGISEEDALNKWLHSPEHRKTLEKAEWTHSCIATNGDYAVQIFSNLNSYSQTRGAQSSRTTILPTESKDIPQSDLIDCHIGGQVYRITKDFCEDAKSSSTYTYSPSLYTPTPNTAQQESFKSYTPSNNNDNHEECSNIKTEWEYIKDQINNVSYSSSAEQAQTLISYQNSLNSKYSSRGCSGYLN